MTTIAPHVSSSPAPRATSPVVGSRGSGWTIERRDGVVFLRAPSVEEVRGEDWQARLAAVLRDGPRIGAVGGLRSDREGTLVSAGEFVVHPKGYHALGAGQAVGDFRFVEECDAIVGGVLAVDAIAFDDAGGAERLGMPLGVLELCLQLRLRDRRILMHPSVVAVDDSAPTLDVAARDAFHETWGFDWRAADLDAVRAQHAGTGLLWNVRHHGGAMPYEKYATRGDLHWSAYRDAPPYRQRADHLAEVVRATGGGGGPILDVGCGDGLFSHLFAGNGAEVIGVDPQPEALELARERVAEREYAGPAPTFHLGTADSLPVEDASVRAVVMLDVIEHLDNPVRALAEAERSLAPGGVLLISTPAWQHGGSSDPVYHGFEFTQVELVRVIEAATSLRVTDHGTIGGVYRDLVVVARR